MTHSPTSPASTSHAATSRLVRRTPLLLAPASLQRPGAGRLLLKLECLQRTGSFKLRGAALALDRLDEPARTRGVVAASAGNHGLGVALAGSTLGVAVTVVVPTTSPRVKRDGIARNGATVVVHGPTYDDAEAHARELARSSGARFLSPFDDPLVIRGNGGSLAAEILDQLAAPPGRVVCPVGGGGLVGGLAAALAPRGVTVIGVQPAANCAMHDSLRDGHAHLTYSGDPTLAEGCEGAVAERTFALCRDHGVAIALVTESAIRRAIVTAYRVVGVILEPSAAVALAGWLEGGGTAVGNTVPIDGDPVMGDPVMGDTVVVLSGGNIEPDLLDSCLSESAS